MKPFHSCSVSRTLKLPIVVSVPHAGLRLPESRKELMMLSEEIFYRDVDFEIHRMWEDVCRESDLSFIKSEVHRYAIDLNRRPDQVDSLSLKRPRAANERVWSPRGIIWTETTRGEALGFGGAALEPLDEGVFAQLVDLVWRPYYAFIESELGRVREKFGYAILIDGHSMPTRGTSFHADPGGERADVVPGDFNGRACATIITDTVSRLAAERKFSVSPNLPYAGGNITQHFGRPASRVHALQIEINRRIYMHSPHELIDDGLARLRDLARSCLAELATLPAHSF